MSPPRSSRSSRSSKPPHVVSVGDLMVDVLAHLPGPLAAGSDTPAEIVFRGGGAAANVAAWLAHAGARSTFVGNVGDDPAGERAVADLTAAGVEAAVRVDPAHPTGTCLVLVDPDGERTMVPSAGANLVPVTPDRLPDRPDWLYVSAYPLLREQTRDATLALIAHARSRHWSIAVDVASAAPLLSAGGDGVLDAIGSGITLFANLAEADVLTGLAEAGAAAQGLALRCGRAIVKRGASGAVWSDGSGVRSVPPTAMSGPVVDTTGAGDAFAAGYLALPRDGDLSLPRDSDVADRLAAAADLAARAVRVVGGRPPIDATS